MTQLKTIPAAFADTVATRPDAGFVFVGEDGREQSWAFPKLHERARSIGAALAERKVRPGDRVAIVLPATEEFIPTFLGVLEAGAVPVPLYPPMNIGQLAHYLDHCAHIVAASRATLLITTTQIKAVIGTVHNTAPDLRAMITFADLEGDPSRCPAPTRTLDDVAFIQFTSGSTSRPKGVVLTHGNLAANCAAFVNEGLRVDPNDRGVSWLPLFHDMGLIGFVIAPVMHAVSVSFMPPLAFLKRPAAWLELLSKHRGTITYAPNFAYALATKRVRDDEIAGLDLSCVRAAGCGAEPIHAETLRAFAARFAKCGFREEAFVPSYGMAESSLAISFARGVPSERVRAASLWERGVAEIAPADDATALELVSCGHWFEGHGLKVVHPNSGVEAAEREVGEVVIRGPSVTQGYFDDPAKTRAVRDEDGWLRTGDLGYVAAGQLFICGRQKDVIILAGKNYYPQDLEGAAMKVPGVRPGSVVAFGARRPGLEREAVVLVAETRQVDARDKLATEIRAAVQRATGVVADEIAVVDVGTIPKTSSGKVQRARTRSLYEAGDLKPRTSEGKVGLARHVVASQLSHLKRTALRGLLRRG